MVFAQLAKYYEGPVSKNLFDQLSGRAGKKKDILIKKCLLFVTTWNDDWVQRL